VITEGLRTIVLRINPLVGLKPRLFPALKLMPKEPASLIAPEITPVLVSIVNPSGKLIASNVVGSLLAIIV
jgi:hypothetical protein